MYLIFTWFLAHLLLIVPAIRTADPAKALRPTVWFSGGLLLLVLIVKPATSDLPTYLDYFSTLDLSIFHGSLEYGFRVATEAFSYVFWGSQWLVHWAWVLIILISTTMAARQVSGLAIDCTVPLLMSSLFFLLASQNALRQGAALSLLMPAVLMFAFKTRLLVSVLLMVVSLLLHDYTILFVLISLSFLVLKWPLVARYSPIFSGVGFACVSGICIGLALCVYANLYGGVYGSSEIGWGAYRSASMVKFIAIFLLFAVTSYVMDYSELSIKQRFVVDFRAYMICILLPLSFSGEIFPRVAIFYLLIEAILMVVLFSSASRHNRFAGAIIALAYGVAPNALNILSTHPRSWLDTLGL